MERGVGGRTYPNREGGGPTPRELQVQLTWPAHTFYKINASSGLRPDVYLNSIAGGAGQPAAWGGRLWNV